MRHLLKLPRAIRELLFRWRGHATIFPIPTEQFNALIANLINSGWRKRSEYQGFDAWIDYGRIVLTRSGQRLLCEWDNWDEGSIESKREVLEPIAREYGLTIVDYWRWSVRDQENRGV